MIVEGINVINELLSARAKIDKIIIAKGERDNKSINEIFDKANRQGIPVQVVSKQDLAHMSKGEARLIMAYIPNFKYVEVEDILLESDRKGTKPFIVILDGIEDPHNLGAIIRTCECAGVDGVIIPENRACEINSTVYKTSSGAIVNMKVAMVKNLTRTINELKKKNIWVYALEAGNKTIYDADFTYPTAIIIGSEGKGVSRLVKESADEILSLDMYGRVNSLNASCAGAIGIYEVVRQRRK